MKIGRTLFWFTDRKTQFLNLNEQFFGLGTLLNRLLNERYDGKKIKFINIKLYSEETYVDNPVLRKNEPYFYNGHLQFCSVIDFAEFNALTEKEQGIYLWEKGYEYLQIAATTLKNTELQQASKYAYEEGIKTGLNRDFRILDETLLINNVQFHACIWILFTREHMFSKFTLEKNGQIIFEKDMDKSKNGTSYFLEIYKSINIKNDKIVIHGHRDVDYLPLSIPIPDVVHDFKPESA